MVAFVDVFRVIRRYRERQLETRRLEREHQLALVGQIVRSIEVITEGSAKQAEENTKAISALASASASQAAAFSTWLGSFTTSASPTSSVVRDADEIAAEDARLAADLPEEFRLAFSLHGNDDFIDSVKKDIKP